MAETAPIESRFIDFEGLRIEYDDRVLAPRPWTAAQSQWAAELIRMAPPGPVLELCAGAGHIGLLAVSLAPRMIVCVDADRAACGYLRRNAALAGVRADVREGRMDAVLEVEDVCLWPLVRGYDKLGMDDDVGIAVFWRAAGAGDE